jgi:hypothetical protein
MESWRRTADLDQVRKDALNLLCLLDNGDDFHFGSRGVPKISRKVFGVANVTERYSKTDLLGDRSLAA